MRRKIALFLITCMLITLVGCTAVATTTSGTGTTTTGKPTATDAGEPYKEGSVIKIGVSAAITGDNKMAGQFAQNGALLAEAQINEAGGILGKKIKIVFADEGNDVQTAVTAATKLLSDPEIFSVIGPSISTYCIASDQVVRTSQKPYIACGSSANIPPLNNTWMYQIRVTDTKAGAITAGVMVNVLKMKNPAILYSNDTYGIGMMEQTVAALKKLGVEVAKSNLLSCTPDEKQYTTFLTQIMNSGADGLFAISAQVQAGLVMTQAADIGLKIPCIGSNSYSSAVSRTAAGDKSNGWYACTDWTEDGQTGFALKYIDANKKMFNTVSDKSGVYAYDAVRVLAEAVKIAGTANPASVNKVLATGIKNFEGAMANYTSSADRSLADRLLVTKNEKGIAKLIDTYKY